MADVSLLRCVDYSLPGLKRIMAEGMEAAGFGLSGFRGMQTLLKPNLLSAVSPDTAVITHPVFFRAAAEIVIDHGGRPVLAESPAVASLNAAMKASGYDRVVEDLGIAVADASAVAKISCEEAERFKTFEVSRAFLDADIILNLPKFKTHGLTYTTASVKNLFGAVPGMRKSQMHLRFPASGEFSEAVLDLNVALSRLYEPSRLLHVMDAVIALEGDGPGTSGRPRAMNAVITGRDGLAVDWVAVSVSGLDPRLSPILASGFRRGLISSDKDIRVIGRTIDEMQVRGFRPPQGPGLTGLVRVPVIQRVLKRLFMARPVPVEEKCTLCRQCMKVCPMHAITEPAPGGAVPEIDYSTCIRCLCCTEVCTQNALLMKEGTLQWMLGKRL